MTAWKVTCENHQLNYFYICPASLAIASSETLLYILQYIVQGLVKISATELSQAVGHSERNH